MKKNILKSFVSGLVFFGTGFLIFFLAKARNGLQSSPGDKLTSATWNQLITKLNGESRITPTLQNGYYNVGGGYSTAGYYKDGVGVVHLKGGLYKNPGGNGTMFTLPVGYRPAEARDFIMNIVGAGGARTEVRPNGEVTQLGGTTNTSARISIDGISFRAEQ